MCHLSLLFLWIFVPHQDAATQACASDLRISQLNQTTERLFDDPDRAAPNPLWRPAEPLNEIDDYVFATLEANRIPINQLCDDATFLRRSSLVLTGRLPDPELTRSFLASNSEDKRAILIDTLLQSDGFNTHWAFWYQEMFESTARILRVGRVLYNEYFDQAVAENKPFDQMAYELLTNLGITDQVAEPNYYARAAEMSRLAQDFWDNSAVFTTEKFLGVRTECVSCHDGAYHLEDINLYLAERKREDLWGLAAFFAELNRRPATITGNLVLSIDIYKNPRAVEGYLADTDSGDRPERAGGLIEPVYMFDGRGVDANLGFLDSLATYVVSDRQFARNFANRLWAHAFGIGMVEPIDSFDLYRIDPTFELPDGWEYQSYDIALLEHMADQVLAMGYDLRATLRYICNSATFQMAAKFPTSWNANYTPYYTRYMARRMTAEMVYDSLVQATGVAVTIRQQDRNTTPTNVTYAHELDDLNQPTGRDDTQAAIRTFLDAFGRGNRFDVPRTEDGGIAQALQLMNSDVTLRRVNQGQGRLTNYLNANMTISQIVDELYLDFLCRRATEEERQAMVTELGSYGSITEQARTALWLMANKLEFVHIY